MRALGKPDVLKSAATASLVTSVLCFPRMWLWTNRVYPIWYLEALLFLGGIVLWAFVFAWHTKYTHRPVFAAKLGAVPAAVATISGVGAAILLRQFIDPGLRARSPEDYPLNIQQWVAMTLFSLAFTQLFLVFAPFAWLVRLSGRPQIAAALTVAFGVVVMMVKNGAPPGGLPPMLFLELLAVRLAAGGLSIYLFLRGGVFLVWWWGLLVQARLLWNLGQGAA